MDKEGVTQIERVVASPHDEVYKPDTLTLVQGLRRYPKVASYCLLLTTTILLWGFDLAMVGNLAGLDQFKHDYGFQITRNGKTKWVIAAKWLSAWNAASPAGMMIGSIAGGFLQDRLGRRPTLALGSLGSALGTMVILLSAVIDMPVDSRGGLFTLGKFIAGLTLGVTVTASQTYMSEVLPPSLRGSINAFFPIFFLFGQLMSAVIIFSRQPVQGPKSYLTCIHAIWAFSIVPAVAAATVPESPVWLLRRGKVEAASRSETRLQTAGTDISTNIQALQRVIDHERPQNEAESSTYWDCFKGVDRRRTWIAVLGACSPKIWGITLLGDGPYFAQIAGQKPRPSLIFLMSGIGAGILSNGISLWLLTVQGRRRLILSTLFVIAFLWLGMGICATWESKVAPWFINGTMLAVVFVAGLGCWPAAYVVQAEVSSLRLRAKTQGIAWASQGVVNFVISTVQPYAYNTDAGNLRAKVGYIWFVLAAIAFTLTWFYIPEMSHRTAYQLDLMFEARLPTRGFEKWGDPGMGSARLDVESEPRASHEHSTNPPRS